MNYKEIIRKLNTSSKRTKKLRREENILNDEKQFNRLKKSIEEVVMKDDREVHECLIISVPYISFTNKSKVFKKLKRYFRKRKLFIKLDFNSKYIDIYWNYLSYIKSFKR